MPLYRDNRFIGLGNGEPLGRLAYDTAAVSLERYYRRSSSAAFAVCYYDGFAAFHNRHARVGRAEVDTYYFSHNLLAP